MDLNITRVRRFLAVYRQGSFTRAAEDLGLTHSALTKSLQQLEQDLGVEVFDRTTRSVVPTAAGHRLAARAEELLAFADQISDEFASGSRHINLIAGPAVIEASLAPVLSAFSKRHPDVRVTAETMPPELAVARLRRREAQVLLYHATTLRALPETSAFRMSTVIDEPYVALMRKDHPALHADLSLDALLHYKWAIPGYDRLFRAAMPPEIEEKYRRAGFPHYRVLSLGTCLALAADSDMITLLPEPFARRVMRSDAVACRSLALEDGARYVVKAVTLANIAPDPIVEDLIGMFAALPEWEAMSAD